MHSRLSTRISLGKLPLKAAVWSLCALLAAPSALARDYNYNKEMTQQDAMGYGSNNYWNGSGDSKDEGVRNGMRAVGRLAALDIGGAIHYGYKGYGNYLNSQQMDRLDKKAWSKKDVMNSMNNAMINGTNGGGAGSASSDATGVLTVEKEYAHPTTGGKKSANGESAVTERKWKDMDRGFLYRGETAEAAAEFEKKSGMSRDEFFDHVASIADANLSFDDPGLMDKLEGRYQAFVNRIPNKDFKGNIEKVHSMFSFVKKTEMLQEAAAFYQKNRGPQGGDEKVAGDVTGKAVNSDVNGAGKTEAADRAPASTSEVTPSILAAQTNPDPKESKLTKEQMGMYLGLDGPHGDELKEIMVNTDETIFKIVSKRYRKLTPGLIGRAM